jgi:hypothetical protein
MFRTLLVLLGATLMAASSRATAPAPPASGFVPDSITAIKIAVAVWTPIYGARLIASEKPYQAQLRGDTWIVAGSVPQSLLERVLHRSSFGGAAVAEIARSDARIIRVAHTQ